MIEEVLSSEWLSTTKYSFCVILAGSSAIRTVGYLHSQTTRLFSNGISRKDFTKKHRREEILV